MGHFSISHANAIAPIIETGAPVVAFSRGVVISTFVLIHGGGHKAKHWELLRPILEQAGHRTIAPDVPMDVVGLGATEWADVVVDAITRTGDEGDVILVGHSLAGLVLPVIAVKTPIQRMVFLCALVPTPGQSWGAYVTDNPSASTMPWGRVIIDDQNRMVMPWDLVRERFYQDCDEDQARAAFQLVVPTAQTAIDELCPIDAWPNVPSTYILCQDDLLIAHDWSRQIAVERFGAPALELPGSHSPMLSRPDQLATVLDTISKQ
jgi:pimeloyl-ACP methyl ester carboxylesterase